MKRVLITALFVSAFGLFTAPVSSQGFDWAAHFSSTEDVQVQSVAHDPGSDEVSAIIVFQGTVSFNGGAVYSSFGDMDIMLVRMDSDGDTLWTHQFGSPGKDLPKDVALDASGNIYATGSFSDGADFGGTVLNSLEDEDIFLVKVLANGTVDWAVNAGGGLNQDRGNSLVVDPDGNIHVVGFFQDSLLFTGDTLVTNGKKNNFAAEYSNSGTFIKASHFINTTVNSDRFNSISLAHDGGTLISGFFRDSIKYNDPVEGWIYITSVGGDDLVLFKFNQSEEIEWVRTGGGPGADRGYDATSDALGNIYLGGYFTGTANLDSTDLGTRDSRDIEAVGGTDIFVAKYNSQGTLQWISETGGSGEDIIRGVDLDQNLFHFAGHFSDTIITAKNDTLGSTGPTDQDIYFSVSDLFSSDIAVGQTKGSGYETTQGLAYDGMGAEYLAGYFESASLEVGELSPLSNGGGSDGVLIKYSFPFSLALIQHKNVTCNSGADGQLTIETYFGQSPYDYDWSHNPSLESAVASGLDAGTYKVVVTDNTGEKDSIEVEVTEPTAIQIDRSITDVQCYEGNDGAIDITVSGGIPGYTYLWTGGSGLIPTDPDQTGLSAASYTVTVTDTNGCTQDSTFVVDEPTELVIEGFNKGDVTAPAGSDGWAKVNVSGGTPAYSYDWSNSGTTDSIYNLTSGTYNVEVTDANGCIKQSDNVIITEPGMPWVELLLLNHVSCKDSADGSARAAGGGGTPPYSYSFSSGTVVDDTIATELGPGWIVVTLEDDVGATVKDSVMILEPAELVVTKTLTDASCHNVCNGVIDISVTGGTLPYYYLWDRAGETEQDLTSVCAGSLFTVTVTDANGCIKENTGFVDEPDSIEMTFAVTDVTCFGDNDGELDLTVTGGTPGYTYLWSNTLTSEDIDFLFADEYWVRITDDNGCQNSDTVMVNEPDELLVNAIELKPACFARTDGETQAIVSGGTAPYTYLWDDPSGQTDSIATSLDPNRSYEATVSDQNGCEASDAVYMNEQAAISIATDSVVDVKCSGASTGAIYVTLSNGQEPYTFNWEPSGDTTEDVINVPAGDYTLEATDAFGCELLPDYENTITDLGVEIVIGTQDAGTVSCYGLADAAITLEATAGNAPFMYSVNDGVDFQAGTLFENLAAGSYITVVRDVNGCLKYADTLTVVEPDELLIVTLVPDTINGQCMGTLEVTISGGTADYTFELTGDIITTQTETVSELSHTFDSICSDQLTITVTDANGCNVESADVEFLTDIIRIKYVSGVTIYPNPSEGQFTIEMNNEEAEDLMLEIVNITGQLVYKKLHEYDGQAVMIRTIDLGNQAKGSYFMRVNGLPVKAKLMIE